MQMSGRSAHWMATVALSAVTVALGVGVVASSIANGSSAISARLLIGVLIVAAGVGRMYIALRRGRGA
jgi:hypothetical protein